MLQEKEDRDKKIKNKKKKTAETVRSFLKKNFLFWHSCCSSTWFLFISTGQQNYWRWGVAGDAGRSIHQSKSRPAPSDILLRKWPLPPPPAAPWIKPSDPCELINKVCRGPRSLCCACNHTVLNWRAAEVRGGEEDHHTPDLSWWEWCASLRRREWFQLGGSLRERTPQMGPLAALRLALLHLGAASKREFRMTEVFHTGAFRGSNQMESLFFALKHTHTHGWSVTHANTRTRRHVCTRSFLATQQRKARIMMTGGAVWFSCPLSCSH